jgi:hypothetical protein
VTPPLYLPRWDSRYIPPADEYGFSLHQHPAATDTAPAGQQPGLARKAFGPGCDYSIGMTEAAIGEDGS